MGCFNSGCAGSESMWVRSRFSVEGELMVMVRLGRRPLKWILIFHGNGRGQGCLMKDDKGEFFFSNSDGLFLA